MKFIRRWIVGKIEKIVDARIDDTQLRAQMALDRIAKLREAHVLFKEKTENIFAKTKMHQICEDGTARWFNYEDANNEFKRMNDAVYEIGKRLTNHIKRGKK